MTVAAQAAMEVVTLRHRYNFGADRVFSAWSNPEALGRWFGPRSHNSIVEKYEFEEGGVFQIRMVPTGKAADCAGEAEADSVCAGRFVKIDAPNRIVMTFDWVEGGAQMGETLLSVEFAEVDGGTEITLVHEKIPSEELRQAHAGGWQGTLECLQEYLA
jgi:uncharacterized protein YndB with AHSA1/START domain